MEDGFHVKIMECFILCNNFTQKFGQPDKIVRSAKSEAPPGKWAIAYCNSGKLGGDKTYYECW